MCEYIGLRGLRVPHNPVVRARRMWAAVLWWEGFAWKRKRKGPARTPKTWGFSALGVDISRRVDEVSAPPQCNEKRCEILRGQE